MEMWWEHLYSQFFQSPYNIHHMYVVGDRLRRHSERRKRRAEKEDLEKLSSAGETRSIVRIAWHPLSLALADNTHSSTWDVELEFFFSLTKSSVLYFVQRSVASTCHAENSNSDSLFTGWHWCMLSQTLLNSVKFLNSLADSCAGVMLLTAM